MWQTDGSLQRMLVYLGCPNLQELQHPTGLQIGLAGGAAGSGGLPPDGEEEGEDPGCLPGGPRPAAGEGGRALVRGAQPH